MRKAPAFEPQPSEVDPEKLRAHLTRWHFIKVSPIASHADLVALHSRVHDHPSEHDFAPEEGK